MFERLAYSQIINNHHYNNICMCKEVCDKKNMLIYFYIKSSCKCGVCISVSVNLNLFPIYVYTVHLHVRHVFVYSCFYTKCVMGSGTQYVEQPATPYKEIGGGLECIDKHVVSTSYMFPLYFLLFFLSLSLIPSLPHSSYFLFQTHKF